MKKADLDASQVGTSVSLVDKQRNAIRSILKSKPRSAQFEPDELKVMRGFVQGTMPERAMRLLGKLSPTTGSPLSAILNLGAIGVQPKFDGGVPWRYGGKIWRSIVCKQAI